MISKASGIAATLVLATLTTAKDQESIGVVKVNGHFIVSEDCLSKSDFVGEPDEESTDFD